MAIHFEELWEKCENLQKDASAGVGGSMLIDEIVLKLNLYKAISEKLEIPLEERQKAQYRIFGEILLAMTSLSLKGNVNVYEALSMALQMRGVEYYSSIHPQP